MGKWRPEDSAEPAPNAPDQLRARDVKSFIVRISKQEQEPIRGWVEEAESGEKTSFLGFDELRDVLSKYMAG